MRACNGKEEEGAAAGDDDGDDEAGRKAGSCHNNHCLHLGQLKSNPRP